MKYPLRENAVFDDFVGTWGISSKAHDVKEEDIVNQIEINDRFVEIWQHKSFIKYSYQERNIENGKLVLELESTDSKDDSLQITFERFKNQTFSIRLNFDDTKTLEFAGQLRKDSSYTSNQKDSKPRPSANAETKIHKAFMGRWSVTDENGKNTSLFHEVETVAIGDETVLLNFKHGTFLYEIKSLEVAADYLTFNLIGRAIAHKLEMKCEKGAAADAMKISLIRKLEKPISLNVSRSTDAYVNATASFIPKSIKEVHADSIQQYLGRWQIQSDAESAEGPKYGFTSVDISPNSITFPFTEPHDGAVRQTSKGFHITSLALTEDTLTFSSMNPETNQEVRIKCTRDTQNDTLLSMSVTNTEEVPKALALTRR